jgi:hypothetical protein
MHGRRTGRIVATTIVMTLAIVLTGCADRTTQSVPPPAVSSTQPQASPADQPQVSPSALEPNVAPSPASSPAADAATNPARVINGKSYRPAIDPADFSTTITNQYMPLLAGTVMTYEGAGERGVFTVTDRTRTVMGVTAIVVRDQAYEDGALVEDTEDWFAQDSAGNVWYFGEATAECDGRRIVGRHGSWEAGVDGAQPGIVMLASPDVGDYYRQEYFKGEAEDVAKVIRLDATVTNALGTYPGVVITEDFSKLEPALVEHKKYAPGVGLVAEQTVKGGSGVVQLIGVDPTAGSGASATGRLCAG